MEIYTDGSYSSTTKLCGYGVYFPNNEYKNISEKFCNKPTNQRAELYAIYAALNSITKKHDSIIIYSDSQYSIKSCTLWIKKWKENNWKTVTGKPVKNLDIIKPIDDLLNRLETKIEFRHVRSHTNKKDKQSINNDIVDGFAKNGALK